MLRALCVRNLYVQNSQVAALFMLAPVTVFRLSRFAIVIIIEVIINGGEKEGKECLVKLVGPQ